jgi:hypothetical protein
MAEPTLLPPDPFADLPFPEFHALIDGDNFTFEDIDLDDLNLDVDFDLDLFASDRQLCSRCRRSQRRLPRSGLRRGDRPLPVPTVTAV